MSCGFCWSQGIFFSRFLGFQIALTRWLWLAGAGGCDVAVNWLSEVSAVAPEATVSGGAGTVLLDSARLFLRQADAGFSKVRSALAHQELAPMR